MKEEVKKLQARGINPGLAVILVGEDPASQVYVRNKKLACEYIGINSFEYVLPADTTQKELIELIEKLNRDDTVSGILCQLPVPEHINEEAIINAIDPKKDVDAFHPVNVGKIMTGNYDFVPCTPAGVMELIKESGIDVNGKECVVVGRSNIVGKPMSMLLLHKNGTVTICHSRTQNLAEKTRNADILVAAVGIPNFITGDMIKPGAVVIDVGINRIAPKKLVGDVEFESAEKVAGAITPVPGGVGPMTIAMLMKNTLKAAEVNKTK
ncbi:MAG: bifunctional methylenetetrahydrofolate dehydrogenase/methenyltetrahydrofolate cyclohydrolase FolD [Candidatus Ornithomonoglobus sp.]